jgi:hypothetical protein
MPTQAVCTDALLYSIQFSFSSHRVVDDPPWCFPFLSFFHYYYCSSALYRVSVTWGFVAEVSP